MGFPRTHLVGNSVNRGQGAISSPLTASLFGGINQSRRRWVEAMNFVPQMDGRLGRREPVAQPATSEKRIPLRDCGRKEEPLCVRREQGPSTAFLGDRQPEKCGPHRRVLLS